MIERDGHRVFNPAWRFFLDAGRDSWQQPERVLDALGVGEGAVVADVGAGTGYFTWRLAERVGASGRVFATDVQEPMVAELEGLVRERRLENVAVVHAGFDDPGLPEACCELVLLVHVYKELDARVAYMRQLARALAEGGRVAIVEFLPEAAGPGPPREVRLAPERIVAELGEAGFALTERHEFLEGQSFLVFVRGADAAAPARASP